MRLPGSSRGILTLLLSCALVLTGCGDDDESTEDSGTVIRDGAGPDVVVVGDGEALVTWEAPTTREDGTGLMAASIGGYRVHYGVASGTYDTTIDVGRTASQRITGLTVGTRYYFAVTTYDISDRESGFSDEAFKDF